MIVVEVTLHSAISGRKSSLGVMVIDNIGGSRTRGNYRCRMYRKGYNPAEKRNLDKGIVREGRVENHQRLAKPVHDLVAKCLDGMGYPS